MYESYEKLRIKERAGIKSAARELQYRKKHRELLSLYGLQNMAIYIVQTEEIQRHLDSVERLYQKVSSEKKEKEIILLDAFHFTTIEGQGQR